MILVLFNYMLPTGHLPTFAMCNDHLLLKFIPPMTLMYVVTTNRLLKQVLQITGQFTVLLFYRKYFKFV